jgi:hypothetical protein
MIKYTTVGDIARGLSDQLGRDVRPADITNLYYRRILPDDHCPVVAGRRLIPLDMVPAIEAKLRERGRFADHAGEVVG